MWLGVLAAYLAVGDVLAAQPADPRRAGPPVSAVPADAMFALLLRPGSRNDVSQLELAARLIARGRQMGLLSGFSVQAALRLDAFAALEVVLRYPAALVVLDVGVDDLGDGSHRLGALEMAIVLRSGADHATVAATIQKMLNRHTRTDVSRLQAMNRQGRRVFRLTDRRLPPWAVLEWGAVGDVYIVALGAGSFDACAAAMGADADSLASDAWFAHGRDRLDADAPRVLGYWSIERMVSSLAAGLGDLPRDVLAGTALAGTRRAMFCVASRSRALRIAWFAATDEGDRLATLAAPASDAELACGVVPDCDYALFRFDPLRFVSDVRDAYMRCRSPDARRRLRAYWSSIEQRAGVSIERDLLHQLGPRLILHNDPPHPLAPGAASTIQFEISGSANSVRHAVDELLSVWVSQRNAAGAGARDHAYHWLKRTDTGRWQLQFGLLGPSLAVHDDWIVISISPWALGRNIDRLSREGPLQADAE